MSDATIAAAGRHDGVVRDLLDLGKARIVLMVLVTAAAGFVVALPGSIDLLLLFHTLVGTALIAGGTNALNEYAERELDARMVRTNRRPLPSGRMSEKAALAAAIPASVGGAAYLYFLVNPLSAAIAASTLLIYLFIYTPLKRRTPWCTLVGAVPGALPPLIGWAAASGSLNSGAWSVFAILFLWQMPHFMAISWLYKDDYARAGFAMTSVDDPDGTRTSRQAMIYGIILMAASFTPFATGIADWMYLVVAFAMNAALFHFLVRFAQVRSSATARSLFLYTNLYLTVLMAALVAESLLTRS